MPTVVSRPQFIAGCWSETSVSCYVDLSIGLLTAWQLPSCRASDESEREGMRGRERENPRQKTVFFYNLVLEVAYHHFCSILWLTQTDPGTIWKPITRRCKYQEVGGHWGPSWKVATTDRFKKYGFVVYAAFSFCWYRNSEWLSFQLSTSQAKAEALSLSIFKLISYAFHLFVLLLCILGEFLGTIFQFTDSVLGISIRLSIIFLPPIRLLFPRNKKPEWFFKKIYLNVLHRLTYAGSW